MLTFDQWLTIEAKDDEKSAIGNAMVQDIIHPPAWRTTKDAFSYFDQATAYGNLRANGPDGNLFEAVATTKISLVPGVNATFISALTRQLIARSDEYFDEDKSTPELQTWLSSVGQYADFTAVAQGNSLLDIVGTK